MAGPGLDPPRVDRTCHPTEERAIKDKVEYGAQPLQTRGTAFITTFSAFKAGRLPKHLILLLLLVLLW